MGTQDINSAFNPDQPDSALALSPAASESKPLSGNVLEHGGAISQFDQVAAVRLTQEQWSIIARRLNLIEGGQEMAVLRGIAASLSDTGIEQALGISHGTLRTYMDRLFHKCGARNRVGVIMKAMEQLLTHTQ